MASVSFAKIQPTSARRKQNLLEVHYKTRLGKYLGLQYMWRPMLCSH